MKTYSTKASDIKRDWYVVDASGKVLGRLASQVAKILMGKNKAIFCRNMDVGDFVVVTNAEKIAVTGKKLSDKIYYRHSGYPGGLKEINLGRLLETHPTRAVEHAVKGMLPHNRLQARMMKRLKVVVGEENPYRQATVLDTGEKSVRSSR